MSESITLDAPPSAATPEESSRIVSIAVRALGLIPGLRGTSVTGRLTTAIHGSAWTFVGYGASQVLKLLSTLILARLLLDPKTFGLMALVNVFLTGLEVLSDLGIGLDIVQDPRGEDPVFLNTAFFMQMGRSLLLCAMAVGLAIPFAAFYHQPEVRWLATVGSFSIGIRGFVSMSLWLMTRRVQIGKVTTINLVGDAVGLITSVIWAWISPTAWALVAGKVASAIAYVAASHFYSDWRPSFTWERRAARDILIFGSGIFLSSATYFFSSESERLIVGKFATVAELGCFSLALSMSYAPFVIVQRVISNVFFPMISNIAREDETKAAFHFKKFRLVFFFASVLMGLGFIVLSHFAVKLLLRPQYADTAWMLQLLGFRSALELFGSAASVMLLAVGVTRYAAIGNTAKLVFMALGLFVAFGRFGLHGAIWVLAVSPFVHYCTMLIGLSRRCKFVVPAELAYFGSFVAVATVAGLLYRAFA